VKSGDVIAASGTWSVVKESSHADAIVKVGEIAKEQLDDNVKSQNQEDVWKNMGVLNMLPKFLSHQMRQASNTSLRKFACECASQVVQYVECVDERSVQALRTSKRFALGEITKDDLGAAHLVAQSAFEEARESYLETQPTPPLEDAPDYVQERVASGKLDWKESPGAPIEIQRAKSRLYSAAEGAWSCSQESAASAAADCARLAISFLSDQVRVSTEEKLISRIDEALRDC
jgi:hypothetical protein